MNNREDRMACAAALVAAIGLCCAQLSWGIPPRQIEEAISSPLLEPGAYRAAQEQAQSVQVLPRPVAASAAAGPGTGADTCDATTPVVVNAGAPGFPNTVTINGDSSTATGPDCGGGLTTTWWESFVLDKCADVTIDFCGSSPVFQPSYVFVVTECGAGGTCGPFLSWDGTDGTHRQQCPNFPSGDTNITMQFSALPAGTYYYPIIADGAGSNVPGPYVMNITAEECVGACTGCLGACCDTAAETCTDDVLEVDCAGANEDWTARARCCEVECRDPAGPTYDAQGVNLLSHVPLSSFSSGSFAANDVWGYVSPSGREYAIIGLSDGTGFVEVTNPAAPVVLADIPDATSTWSDMKTYGEFAYNVNETGGGMQIIDLTQIDSGIVSLLGSATGGMSTAHNVALNPQSGYAYPCGTDIVQGFIAFHLGNPVNPQPVGTWSDQYVHDLYVQSYDTCPWAGRAGQPCEIAFAFCGGAGFYIIDVTDKAAMATISSMTYPTLEYCHQGWITADKRYIIMNDELDELFGAVGNTRTYVVDVQDLKNPVLVHEHDHPGCWIDHNLHVANNNVYQAHYAAGLRVLNASNPTNLFEFAYFDTHPESNIADFVGAWGVHVLPSGVVLVSDIERGLFVLEVKPLSCPPSSRPERATLIASGTPQPDAYSTNRYLPVRLDADGIVRHVQVTAVQLPPPHGGSACDGQIWWAGAPYPVCEKANQGEKPGTSCQAVPGVPKGRNHNWYADLVCDQNLAAEISVGTCEGGVCLGGFAFHDPCSDDSHCQTLYLKHECIVPSARNDDAVYDIRAIAIQCAKVDPSNYSPPLTVTQDKLGNLVGVGTSCENPAPDAAVGLPDVNALLAKFANSSCQIKKARGDIRGAIGGFVDNVVSLPDINAVLFGFTNPTSLNWNPPADPCQFGAADSSEDARRTSVNEPKSRRNESSRDR